MPDIFVRSATVRDRMLLVGYPVLAAGGFLIFLSFFLNASEGFLVWGCLCSRSEW